MAEYTITELNQKIDSILSSDRELRNIFVRGEIVQVNPYRLRNGGDMYFITLTDKTSKLGAMIFPNVVSRLGYVPEPGMSVIIMGDITVHVPNGAYRINITDMNPVGAGASSMALKQLKEKLRKAGVFDNERPLPRLPKRIGVVTSKNGRAVNDIIRNLEVRYPLGEVYISHTKVQGEGAPEEIAAAIYKAADAGCDVIIVGRGGGGTEDLSAFNDEKVAYAVYNCPVPVISAVGHQDDYTICDLAADRRESTPTGAAMNAAPSTDMIKEWIDSYMRRAETAVNRSLNTASDRFSLVYAKLSSQSPQEMLKRAGERIESLENRNRQAIDRTIERFDSRLISCIRSLDALSPLKVMTRGYSLAYKGEELIRSADVLSEGDTVTLRFSQGSAEAEIKKVNDKG
ncbi:MAG: exodeoxyribonuclease VII large subunit [Ruminococcus sp.]|nr:exodeoxyribonuclease VII large subunit [Ruminococcus sp.]